MSNQRSESQPNSLLKRRSRQLGRRSVLAAGMAGLFYAGSTPLEVLARPRNPNASDAIKGEYDFLMGNVKIEHNVSSGHGALNWDLNHSEISFVLEKLINFDPDTWYFESATPDFRLKMGIGVSRGKDGLSRVGFGVKMNGMMWREPMSNTLQASELARIKIVRGGWVDKSPQQAEAVGENQEILPFFE